MSTERKSRARDKRPVTFETSSECMRADIGQNAESDTLTRKGTIATNPLGWGFPRDPERTVVREPVRSVDVRI